MPNKRVVVISDPHCGHRVGLTPPAFQGQYVKDETDLTKIDKFVTIRRRLWHEYQKMINALKPIDILIVNGDCIDGKGFRSGSTELIETDRDVQGIMAATCIAEAESPIIRMTYGTAYHTGLSEDWENNVVKEIKINDPQVDVKIGSHEWVDVNGVIIDFKHFTASTTIPHGQGTSLAKDWLWNALWAEQELQPRADIYIRSHVHVAYQCGRPNSWYACTTPALQGMGSKFGSRICKGIVDFGVVSFDITESGAWKPNWDTIIVKEQATKAEQL